MSDDLASLRWHAMSGQKAPVIVRRNTAQGIWHSAPA
jgi:hypothetical protein